MKLRVIEKSGRFYPQIYNRIYGWKYVSGNKLNRVHFTTKDDAVTFCELELKKYRVNVVWSCDQKLGRGG